MADRNLTFRDLAAKTKRNDRRGLSHTYLVQMARGTAERTSAAAIEIVAQALTIDPSEIAEYRLAKAREQLDPAQVGLDRALEALEAFEISHGAPTEAGGRRVPVPESLKRRAQGAEPSRGGPGEARERGAA